MRLIAGPSPAVERDGVVLVPVGATEQHGPHLPLDTDTVIATAVADGIATLLGGVVAPPLAYGSSGEHQSFAGTVSIGTEVLHQVIVEMVRSLGTWASKVVLVNGHGGNVEALKRATTQMRAEGHHVESVDCSVPGVAGEHAGVVETSLMLHLAPERVQMDRAVRGNTLPLVALLPLMRAGGVASVSPNGILGDPSGASAEEGQLLLRRIIESACDRLANPVVA